MKILAIVPARSGSKSIVDKNINLFCGKPLLAWSIEAGLSSGVVDRLVLTTDSLEYAEIGKKYGAEVPFIRPPELAQDASTALDYLRHTVSWLKDQEDYRPDCVVLLEPTSPGRQAFHVTEAVNLLIKTGADSVVSMAEVPGHYNPHWQFNVEIDGAAKLFTGESVKKIIRRRQDLPKTYFRNGAIYVFKTDLLFADEPSIYGDNVRAYLMGSDYSFDIDSPEDWLAAEKSLQAILIAKS